MNKRVLMIDGKQVRCWLFAYRQKNAANDFDVFLCQVQAFDLDHARQRILLAYPRVVSKHLEMLEELDPEHDVGRMGAFLPMAIPGATHAPGSHRLQ